MTPLVSNHLGGSNPIVPLIQMKHICFKVRHGTVAPNASLEVPGQLLITLLNINLNTITNQKMLLKLRIPMVLTSIWNKSPTQNPIPSVTNVNLLQLHLLQLLILLIPDPQINWIENSKTPKFLLLAWKNFKPFGNKTKRRAATIATTKLTYTFSINTCFSTQ